MRPTPAEAGRKRPYDGTPLRPVRVEDDTWLAALEVAKQRGESLSADVIRPALRKYIEDHSAG